MKKNFKKLFLVLAVAVTALICFTFSASAYKEGYFTYNVSNGEVTIIDVDESVSADVTIPSTLGGYSVTAIGRSAFADCDSLTSVTIPESVTIIGNAAFYNCDSLTSVIIPDSVTTIEGDTFCGCKSLTSITIPDSVYSIGEYAFAACGNLKSITISNSVTEIGECAFYFCRSLTDVYYKGSETQWKNINIGLHNDKLTGAIIHYSCSVHTDKDGNKFCDICDEYTAELYKSGSCGTNVTYKWYEDGTVIISGNGAMSNYPSSGSSPFTSAAIKKVIIENGVTNIGRWIFPGCASLESVIIPESVTSIEQSAFHGCRKLATITIPNSVTFIGREAFNSCESLTQIVIPDSVTSIDMYAFRTCTSLINVTFGSSLASIGTMIFENCKNIESVTVSDSNNNFSSVDGVLFNKNKDKLIYYPAVKKATSYTVPSTVIEIAEYAFLSNKLVEITLYSNVTTIKDAAFYNCTNLKDIYYSGKTENWNKISVGTNNTPFTSATVHFLCNHENVTEEPSKDSTCTSIGYTAGIYCNECETWISGHEVISATNHPFKYSSAQKNPTCTEPGYEAGEYCPDCKIWLSGHAEIPAINHRNKQVTPQKNPTCTEIGYTASEYCPDCQTWFVQSEVIPAINHRNKTSYPGQKPTCTQSGYTVSEYCPDCQVWIVKSEVIPSTNHKNKVIYSRSEPTCTQTGISSGEYCPDCKVWLVERETIGKIPHSFTSYVSDENATYASDGTKTAYCDYGCGEKETVTDEGSKLVLGKTDKITATQSTTSIKLTWNAVENAFGYRIFQKTANGWKMLADTTKLSYTISNLTVGTKYTFAVRAGQKVDGITVLASSYTTINTATRVNLPSKVTAAQNKYAIKLSWTACPGATGYRIYYKSGGVWKVCVSTTKETAHTFTNLKAGAKFTFAVRPYIKVDGLVIWSSYVEFTTATKPATVTVKATSTASGKVNLSWNLVNGANGYQIYYKTADGAYKLYKTVNASTKSLTVSSLKSAAKYSFVVRAGIKSDGGNIYGAYKNATVTVK